MSDFSSEVIRVSVEQHPKADCLELAVFGRYVVAVPKGVYKDGDLAVYIQEGSIVPDNILEELNLKGRLSGPEKNRVKAVRLRGILSQGLLYPARDGWEVGQDVSEELGIEKYHPPIPVSLAGDVYVSPNMISYDLENFKRFPNEIQEGEEVIITEKIHGSCAIFGILSEDNQHQEFGRVCISSKGLAKRGLALKPSEGNSFHTVNRRHKVFENVKDFDKTENVFILGEIFGHQDLKYDRTSGDIGFRVFDVKVGETWLDADDFLKFCTDYYLPVAPVLYRGPFSEAVLKDLTSGSELVTGRQLHIREGVVVRPVKERTTSKLERVILKNVSEDYLTRKNGTEYT